MEAPAPNDSPMPSERERVRETVEQACAVIAQSWPLKTFAYRNPLRGLEHLPFDDAVRTARHTLGGRGYLSNDEYRKLYREGAITDEALDAALNHIERPVNVASVELGRDRISMEQVDRLHLIHGVESMDPKLASWTRSSEALDRSPLWDAAFDLAGRVTDQQPTSSQGAGSRGAGSQGAGSQGAGSQGAGSQGAGAGSMDGDSSGPSVDVGLPAGRTLSDWLERLAGQPLIERINDQMIKWNAAFLDEGMSGWGMPGREAGYYAAWRELARHDWSGRLMGIARFRRKVRQLPESAEEAISQHLRRIRIEESQWAGYLSRQLAHLPGWAGFIRWRSENPGYQPQADHPIDPLEFLAVRLFYEVELAAVICRREWNIEPTLPAITEHWRSRTPEYQQRMLGDDLVVKAPAGQEFDAAWRLYRVAQSLGLSPSDLNSTKPSDAATLLSRLDSFPVDDHGPVWLEALEATYRKGLVDKLLAGQDSALPANRSTEAENPGEESPLAHLVFCIDVRSEPMRRQIEAIGSYATLGFAGFFGLPISYQAFDREDHAALCPVILSPQFDVRETVRPDQQETMQTYATGSRWQRLGDHWFHDLKGSVVGAFLLIDLVGLFFATWLVGRTFFQRAFDLTLGRARDAWMRNVATRIPVTVSSPPDHESEGQPGGLPVGFTLDQRTAFVAGALRAMGLTDGFGRFVVVCGHGSTSANNPYFAAYNCGACGGGHGDANARVFVEMANDPEVRVGLKDQGIELDESTWFLAAKHNTVTDIIEMYDLDDVPAGHADDLRRLREDLDRASERQGQNRVGLLPQSPRVETPEAAQLHLRSRSVDWANVRPEWGLSGNAAFVLGRRELTDFADLEGRVFLQSYDPSSDPTGAVLEALMTAPLVVAQWISMEYYFSAVDPVCYGSGSKVTHNVVSGVGVMHGAHGDLQTGLPLQSVNDGRYRYHKPVRLLAVIEAPRQRIEGVIAKHELLQNLLHNEWIHLIAVDSGEDGNPVRRELYQYQPDATWERLS